MKIKDKMTKKIITSNIKSDINQIAILMKKYDIGFIPIENNNKIIGVLTDRDIVINNIYNNDNKLKDYVTTKIISIDENEELEKGLNLMKQYKIKRLLVTNDNKVTGIISLSDILNDVDSKYILEALKEIYQIDKNNHDYKTEIDNFYL